MSLRENITDQVLVLHVQGGSGEAFEALLRRWEERIWRLARKLTGDQQAAWDVSQETWLAISRQINRLEDTELFSAWAYSIAANKSRDWVRRRQRQRRADKEYVDRNHQFRQEIECIQKSYATLKDAIAALSGHDQAILSLNYEEGWSTEDIATILTVPPGTVKSRLFHARQRLRHYLEDQNDE